MAGRRARPGRGVGDKGEPENNPSLVQPPESRAGWPSPISRQLTRAPAHSQPLQLDPTPLRADWPEEARALARMQPGWCRAPPSDQAAPRLQGSRLSQELRVALPQAGQRNPNPEYEFSKTSSHCASLPLSAWCWAESRANAFGKCWFNLEGFTKLLHSPDTLEVSVLAEGWG